jgi:eukaryotic-like serine/threonine-protein kinase
MRPSFSFIKNYLLLDLLHTGATSEVFRAIEITEEGFKKSVVLKRFFPWVSDHQQLIRNYFHQVELYYPKEHPFFVKILDQGVDRGIYYQVRENVRGQSLERLIHASRSRSRPVTLEMAIFIAGQLLRGVSLFCDPTVETPDELRLHGHLNPINVLISYEGDLKIVNYGIDWLSPLYKNRESYSGDVYSIYRSPETTGEKTKPDFRADFFSIGAILFETITGQKLFSGSGMVRDLTSEGMPQPLKDASGKLPRKLHEVIARLVKSDPDLRPARPADVLQDISTLIDLERKRDFALALKNQMNFVFRQEIEDELKKVEDDRNRYAKLLGISIEGEDKFLEKTDVVRMEQLETTTPSPVQAVQLQEEKSLLQLANKESLYPEMSPEEVGDFLDHAVRDLLGKVTRSEERDSLDDEEEAAGDSPGEDILFSQDWQEINAFVERRLFTDALQKLINLQKQNPEQPLILGKIAEVRELLRLQHQSTSTLGKSQAAQEETQPMVAAAQANRKQTREVESGAGLDREEISRRFSMLNAILWILLIVFGILIGIIFFVM